MLSLLLAFQRVTYVIDAVFRQRAHQGARLEHPVRPVAGGRRCEARRAAAGAAGAHRARAQLRRPLQKLGLACKRGNLEVIGLLDMIALDTGLLSFAAHSRNCDLPASIELGGHRVPGYQGSRCRARELCRPLWKAGFACNQEDGRGSLQCRVLI